MEDNERRLLHLIVNSGKCDISAGGQGWSTARKLEDEGYIKANSYGTEFTTYEATDKGKKHIGNGR